MVAARVLKPKIENGDLMGANGDPNRPIKQILVQPHLATSAEHTLEVILSSVDFTTQLGCPVRQFHNDSAAVVENLHLPVL